MPSLLGSKPNQVSTNGELGTMAFREQDQFYNTQQTMGFKNRIINGAMMIDQRNAGASVTPTDAYTLDRWEAREDTDGAISVQQVSDAPTGFVNSLKVTTTTADATLGSTQRVHIGQFVEGLNCSDLAFGSASASTVTLSFQVKSSLTGTFGGVLANSARNRSYPFTYTINSANTWETKTVTIAGDTSGTWVTTNGVGLRVYFGLGVGSTYSGTAGSWQASEFYSATGATSVIGTLNATWQVTGVQLEKGSTATSFDYRPYGTELALCQRYCYKAVSGNQKGIGTFNFASSTYIEGYITFPVTMRATPTLSATSGTNYYAIYINSPDAFNSLSFDSLSSENRALLYNSSEVSGTAGQAGNAYSNNASSSITFSAEL
jgi:hypothetical protein